MVDSGAGRAFGVRRGRVYPASKARSLLHPARRLVQSPRRTVARLGLSPSATVAEIGCGPGYFSVELHRVVRDGRLVLVDLQAAMLELARGRLDGAAGVAYVQGDAGALPLATGSCDAVLVVLVLGEVADRAAFVAEVRRVLRPDGSATFAESRRDSDFVPFAQLCRLLQGAGLEPAGRHGHRFEYTARFVPAGRGRPGRAG